MDKIPDKVTRERAEEEMERTEGLRAPAPPSGQPIKDEADAWMIREGVGEAEETDFERERAIEQEEGIVPEDRGSPAAPSDRPENKPPHPQDVIDISDES